MQHALGHLLQQDRLAGPRRADDQAALAEADRHDQVDDAHVDFVGGRLQHDPLVGMQRRQVVEEDLLGEQVRIVAVDRLDAQQGEVALVFLRRANLAGDRGAGAQAEAANLAGRDVDVVGAGEVVVVGAAEEAEAVGQDFQRALAEHQAVELHPLLEDLKIRSCFLMPVISARFSLRACSISCGIVIRCSSAMWMSPCLICS